MTAQSTSPTFQQRFALACQSTTFAPQGDGPSYQLWDVQRVQDGQKVRIDGVFFTEEEARISADLMKGTLRGARAYLAIYSPEWNPDPAREAALRLEAMQCRQMLARRLGVPLQAVEEAQ